MEPTMELTYQTNLPKRLSVKQKCCCKLRIYVISEHIMLIWKKYPDFRPAECQECPQRAGQQNHKVTIVQSGCGPSCCRPHSRCCCATDCFCLKFKAPQVLIPIIINYHVSTNHRRVKSPYKADNLHTLLASEHNATNTKWLAPSPSPLIYHSYYMIDIIRKA